MSTDQDSEVTLATTEQPVRQYATSMQPGMTSTPLKPLADFVKDQTSNQILGFAAGTVISSVVVKAVEQLTAQIFNWANGSPYLTPIGDFFNISILGSKFNFTKTFGTFFYVVIALLILTLVIILVLRPLLSEEEEEEETTTISE